MIVDEISLPKFGDSLSLLEDDSNRKMLVCLAEGVYS